MLAVIDTMNIGYHSSEGISAQKGDLELLFSVAKQLCTYDSALSVSQILAEVVQIGDYEDSDSVNVDYLAFATADQSMSELLKKLAQHMVDQDEDACEACDDENGDCECMFDTFHYLVKVLQNKHNALVKDANGILVAEDDWQDIEYPLLIEITG